MKEKDVLVLNIFTVFCCACSSEADIVHSGAAVRAVGVGRSEDRQGQHVPQVKIVPFHSEDKQLELDALKHGYTIPNILKTPPSFLYVTVHILCSWLVNAVLMQGKYCENSLLFEKVLISI